MIRCEVRVPACGKSYEFILNEYVKIPMVIAELASIISSYERRSWAKANEKQELLLCDAELGIVLPNEKTLHECRVRSGSTLILV